MLQRVRERQWNKKNKHQVPATYQEGDWVLVHHSRLPAWPRSTSDDPYFGPYKILSVDGYLITVRCSPRLGGTLVCAAQHLKRYYDPQDLCGCKSIEQGRAVHRYAFQAVLGSRVDSASEF